MRKQGWTYYKNNLYSDNPVAVFYNAKGNRVFYVLAIRDGYITTEVIYGIKQQFISYGDARQMNNDTENNQEKAEDRTFSTLVHVCEKFEEDYYNQVKSLLKQF